MHLTGDQAPEHITKYSFSKRPGVQNACISQGLKYSGCLDPAGPRVRNFWQKNNSVEDERDGTNVFFRWNSSCSAEQNILGIPFWTLPWKRKQLGIPFHGTKIEENYRNSLPNPSAKEKTTRNFVPWNKIRSKLLEFFFFFLIIYQPLGRPTAYAILGFFPTIYRQKIHDSVFWMYMLLHKS
jgi:hypothetical protein